MQGVYNKIDVDSEANEQWTSLDQNVSSQMNACANKAQQAARTTHHKRTRKYVSAVRTDRVEVVGITAYVCVSVQTSKEFVEEHHSRQRNALKYRDDGVVGEDVPEPVLVEDDASNMVEERHVVADDRRQIKFGRTPRGWQQIVSALQATPTVANGLPVVKAPQVIRCR